MQAERFGQVFEDLWDSLNASTNKLESVSRFAVGEISLPDFLEPTALPHRIEIYEPSVRSRKLDQAAWLEWLKTIKSAGWQLGAVEFRHTSFDATPNPISKFYIAGELFNPRTTNRALIEGSVRVQWKNLLDDGRPPTIQSIDASHLGVRLRPGEIPFQKVVDEVIPARDKWPFIDPLIVYDLDGDGRPEIILAAKNIVFQLENWQVKTRSALCQVDPGRVQTAQIADFNGDGFADFLCVRSDGVFLYEGSNHGSFDQPPRLAWKPASKIYYALSMTCGDIDGDGDLDVWLTQYKVPYLLGQLATPYYDANDGYPSYLLKNDGAGNFNDATIECGLAAKRHRRTYSASFADLDGDGDVDLVVVSDFSGVDLYRNDGKGVFTDVTREWAGEPYLPGMAHAIADFNTDGHLDLLAIGMTSPTVDRLEHLSLKRGDSRVDESKRGKLMVGNRLLIGKTGSGFSETGLSASIARSGWSWGCGAADFDNDGSIDVYIATGHETQKSVRDFESQFWLHDVYIGNSSDDTANLVYFAAKSTATRGRGYSYGGWERNRLFWNEGGQRFREIGHLMGVSIQQDSRNVIACDLDEDGRVDLLTTTFEAWPENKQTLKIFRNVMPDAANWIGVRLLEEGRGTSPIGVTITLQSQLGTTVREIVTGDSYRSQHPNAVHFGLGSTTTARAIKVRWSNGRSVELENPDINRYHDVKLPNK